MLQSLTEATASYAPRKLWKPLQTVALSSSSAQRIYCAREIAGLSAVPESVRAANYLNQSVRRVSNQIAQVAAFPLGDADLVKGICKTSNAK